MTNPQNPNASVPLDLGVAQRLTAAVERFGEEEVIDRALALLAGANAGEEFLLYAGGRHAQGVLDGAPPLYWPEVWGARALLGVWAERAVPAVTAGLGNQSWRVREMCAKVVAERAIPCADAVLPLLKDDTARVRAAAARALGVIGDEAASDQLRELLRDPDVDVRRTARSAIDTLRRRATPSTD